MIIRDLFPTALSVQFQGSWDVEVTHLAYDSRAVQPGALFFALPGTKSDGARFVDEAIRRGARRGRGSAGHRSSSPGHRDLLTYAAAVIRCLC